MLQELRSANYARDQEYKGSDQIDVAFRAVEFAGEAGEVANAVKKYLRGERGIAGSTNTTEDIALEMADVLITLDLLAMQLGINLEPALRKKFNQTSDKLNLATKLLED